MGVKIRPARFATMPLVQRYTHLSAATFKLGAVLIRTADGDAEAAADPVTEIVGIAAQPASSGPGFETAGPTPLVVTGREYIVSVWMGGNGTTFSSRAINGGTDPYTPSLANVGARYAFVKTGDDWVVDIADTTNVAIEVIDVDVDLKLLFWRFLDTVLAFPNA
jgi:hypothetical protein